MKEVLEFLKNAKTYYLITLKENKPDSRPFGTIHEFEGKLYFQTGRNKEVYKQLKANSNINICAFYAGKWIRLDALAIEDERIEASESLLKEYPELSGMYKAGDGNCTVFYLKNVKARICSFSEKEKLYEF